MLPEIPLVWRSEKVTDPNNQLKLKMNLKHLKHAKKDLNHHPKNHGISKLVDLREKNVTSSL